MIIIKEIWWLRYHDKGNDELKCCWWYDSFNEGHVITINFVYSINDIHDKVFFWRFSILVDSQGNLAHLDLRITFRLIRLWHIYKEEKMMKEDREELVRREENIIQVELADQTNIKQVLPGAIGSQRANCHIMELRIYVYTDMLTQGRSDGQCKG